MGSQFVDFDADGQIDIVSATFDGSPHVAYGTKEGYEEPTHVLDRDGKRIALSMFWDYDQERWTKSGETQCTSAAAFDWDNDGDLDLLLGEYGGDGGLYLQRNEGKAGSPSFSGANELLHAGGKAFALKGGVSAPRLVDWDSDGLMDLVIGSFGASQTAKPAGGVYLYRNIGKKGAPVFDAALALIAPSASGASQQTRPHVGLYADPVDVDGDGDLDLIVGGYSIWQPKKPALTAEQVESLEKLRQESEAASEEMYTEHRRLLKSIEDLEGDERSLRWKELLQTEHYLSLSEKADDLSKQVEELDPKRMRKSGVWVYLQEPAAAATIPASSPQGEDSVPRVAEPKKAPTASNPLVAGLKLKPGKDNHYSLSLSVEILKGWHAYDEVPADEAYIPLRVELELPSGLRLEGDWQRPFAMPERGKPGLTLFEGKLEFRCTLADVGMSGPAKLTCKLSYQVCDALVCHRPKTESFTIEVTPSGASEVGRRP